MTIVVDANLLVALISGDPRGDRVSHLLLQWVDENAEWSNLSLLPITYHPLEDASRIIEISLRLSRQSAYDAAYLALAERLAQVRYLKIFFDEIGINFLEIKTETKLEVEKAM